MSRSAEQVYALLVDANPFPDVDAVPEMLQPAPHLRVIDPRRDDMQTETRPLRPDTTPPQPPRRRGWIPAIAAAVVVIVAIGIAALAFRGQETEPATPTEVPTTTLVETPTADPPTTVSAPEAANEQTARDAITAWNSGDPEAFLALFAADGMIQDVAATDEGARNAVAFYLALQQVVSIDGCTASGETVTCTALTIDSLSGPLGVETLYDWFFTVQDGQIAMLDWDWDFGVSRNNQTLAVDMAAYIEANHPEVWTTSFAADCSTVEQYNCFNNEWLASAEAGREMLRLAPEYANQPSVQLARQFIADWNAGNAAALFGSFGETAQFSGIPASDPFLRTDVEFFMAMDNQVAIERCVPDVGSALVPPLVREHQRVTCTAITTDALSGPLGVEIEMDWIFRVNDGAITDFQWMWDEGLLHPQDVAADMVDWIEVNYPEIFAATFAADCSSATEWNCWNDRWRSSPEAAAEILRLADEFRAQADY